MTNLTASFQLTAAADLQSRTITGVLAPYGEVGYASTGATVFEPGSITFAAHVPMLLGHDHNQPVGLLAEHADDGAKVTGTFRIPAVPAGDTALLEASEGLRNGLSVGVAIHDHAYAQDGTLVVKAAEVYEVSLVAVPAFTSARVEKVAASNPGDDTPETPEADEVEETPTEGETVDESTAVVEAAAPADLPRISVQDPFPYRPGVRASYFGDMLNSRHDAEAAHRVSIAQQMMTAAQDSGDVADLLPDGYRPDLYVGQIGVTRPVIDAFQKFAIADAKPFRIPVFVSASGMVADHVEGTNPSDGALEFDNILVTPKAVSGQYTVSREVIDGSVPGIDQIIMNAIREEYANDSESYVSSIVVAGATAGTDITSTVGVLGNMAAFQANRKAAPSFFLAGTSVFPFLATDVDTSGRPMNPYVNPSNAAGSSSRGVAGLNVQGYETPLAWSISGALLGVASDAATWESGLSMWRWEEVDGPANIRFAAFGYIAAAVMRAAGVVKFTLD